MPVFQNVAFDDFRNKQSSVCHRFHKRLPHVAGGQHIDRCGQIVIAVEQLLAGGHSHQHDAGDGWPIGRRVPDVDVGWVETHQNLEVIGGSR